MGLWGKMKAPFSGGPSTPEYSEFTPDPYVGSKGYQDSTKRMGAGYEKAFMDYQKQDPGYSEKDLHSMYMLPAEQVRGEEQQALKRLNQGKSFRGGFQSGGRTREAGNIMAAGMGTRGELRRRTRLAQAEASLKERINKLLMWQNEMRGREGMGMQHTGMENQWNMNMNLIAQQDYQTALGKYERDYATGMNTINSIGKLIASKGMSGGGGIGQHPSDDTGGMMSGMGGGQ